MDDLDNVLGIGGPKVEPVNRNVVKQVSCRVEALALNRADFHVVGLTRDKLTSLGDVSGVVRTEALEGHPQRW